MQCDFCLTQFTEGGYAWVGNQWCMISHVEPHAGVRPSHICSKCANSLSKKEIIQALMKRHPIHRHAVASIIERCKREGYGITFSNREMTPCLALNPPHTARVKRVKTTNTHENRA